MRIAIVAFVPLVFAAACGGSAAPTGDGGASDGGAPVDATAMGADVGRNDGDAGTVETLADVHFVGRFDESTGSDTPTFAYPGSEVVARFEGTELTVDLRSDGELYFEATIDGVRGEAFIVDAGTSTYTLASGLPAGEHEVHLVRRNESWAGATQFLGFGGATLVPSPAPYARLVEFVGDSITCGYGALGAGPSCSFSFDTESEPDAYGAVAARELGVGHVAVAVSGIGLSQNYGGSTDGLMGERYGQTYADGPAWTFAYTPDAVVVSLGTNDFWAGDPGSAFADELDALVLEVRDRFPSAAIFLATSPMLGDAEWMAQAGYFDDVITRASERGDTIRRIDIPSQDSSDGLGCDWHPSATTQALNGHRVAEALRTALGW